MKKLMISFLWLFLLVACQYNHYGNYELLEEVDSLLNN